MPRPSLLQSLLQQPTTKYSSDIRFASPATSVERRTKRGAASDAGSLYSLDRDSETDSLYAGSIKSSQSLGRLPQHNVSRTTGQRQRYRKTSYGVPLSQSQDALYGSPMRRSDSRNSANSSSTNPNHDGRRISRRRDMQPVRDVHVGYQPPEKELPDAPETPSAPVDSQPTEAELLVRESRRSETSATRPRSGSGSSAQSRSTAKGTKGKAKAHASTQDGEPALSRSYLSSGSLQQPSVSSDQQHAPPPAVYVWQPDAQDIPEEEPQQEFAPRTNLEDGDDPAEVPLAAETFVRNPSQRLSLVAEDAEEPEEPRTPTPKPEHALRMPQGQQQPLREPSPAIPSAQPQVPSQHQPHLQPANDIRPDSISAAPIVDGSTYSPLQEPFVQHGIARASPVEALRPQPQPAVAPPQTVQQPVSAPKAAASPVLSDSPRAATVDGFAPQPTLQPSETRLPILSPLAPRPRDPFVLSSFDLILPTLKLVGAVSKPGAKPATPLSVQVRLTTNDWQSHSDVIAYVGASSEQTGLASFETDPLTAKAGETVQCAVRMQGPSIDVWDSDGGKNFTFVVPSSNTSTPSVSQKKAFEGIGSMLPNGSESHASLDSNYYTPEPSEPSTPVISPSNSLMPLSPETPLSLDTPKDAGTPQPAQYGPASPRIYVNSTEAERAVGNGDEIHVNGAAAPSRTYAQPSSFLSGPVPAPGDQTTFYAAPVAHHSYSPPPVQPHPPSHTVSALERVIASDGMSRSSSRNTARTATGPPVHPGMNMTWPMDMPGSMPGPPLPDTSPSGSSLGHRTLPPHTTASPRLSMQVPNEELYGVPAATSSPNSPTSPTSRAASPTVQTQGVTRSTSKSSRQTQAKSDWAADVLANKNTSMCALAIGRVTNTNPNPFDRTDGLSFEPPSSPSKFFGRRKAGEASASRTWTAYKVAFTSVAELPSSNIKAGQVLVHILATALDFWDQARVRELSRRSDGLGFVPGRSFYGKLLQVGADCKLHAGDYVYGLTDLPSSGALAELAVVDKSAVSPAPQCGLSPEQISALPIAGVPAVTAVFPLIQHMTKEHRVLVLGANTGAGYIALQLLRSMKPKEALVAVQVAPSMLNAVSTCKELGADEVIRDEPMAAIARLRDSTFNVVIDCIGGKILYEAARRVVRPEGTFASLVGDELSPNTAKKAFASSLRSLRSAFKKRDSKAVHYWLPMLSETDHRDALEVLRHEVENKGVRPSIEKIWRFQDGPEAFASPDQLSGSHVIRILED